MVLVSTIVLPAMVHATHIVGGEIRYRCLGNNQFEITLDVYRDCDTGIEPFDDPAYIAVYDGGNNLIESLAIPFIKDDTLSAGVFDDCFRAPSNVCVHNSMYQAIVTLQDNPLGGYYQIVYQRCCRNATVQNIVEPLETGAIYDIFLTQSAMDKCNSSPIFREWPPVFICANQPIVFDHSASDSIDTVQDSLVYKLCTPFKGGTFDNPKPIPPDSPPPYDTLQWNAPLYSLENMLGIGNPAIGRPLVIDPQNGMLSGLPTIEGQFVVGICVEEYDRNTGELLTITRRDFQYNVGLCEQVLDLVIEDKQCASDLTTYGVQFNTAAPNVSVTAGVVESLGNNVYIVRGIPIGSTVTISAESSLGACLLEEMVTPPDCSCEANYEGTPPVSGGDQSVCIGDPIPPLVATVDDNSTVDWYDAPTDGNALAIGTTTFTPLDAGIYYAEARSLNSNCVSVSRTPVQLSIQALPTVELLDGSVVCADDLLSYSFEITTNATSISTTLGNATLIASGRYLVSGIPSGQDLVVTAIDANTNCQSTLSITAPTCDCSIIDVATPVSGGDQVICEGEIIPPLSATVGENISIDWYDAPTGGNVLAEETLVFTPTIVGTYYAEARNLINNCTSATRTAITISINDRPSFSFGDEGVACSASLRTFQVDFNTNANDIRPSSGAVIANFDGSYTLAGVRLDTVLVLTLTNSITACDTVVNIQPPTCSCDIIAVAPAVSGGDATICEGETIPQLTATVDNGLTVDWYDGPTGGNLLASSTTVFTPANGGTFYAESRNTRNDCTSDIRTPVSLTVNVLPSITLVEDGIRCATDLNSYTITFTTDVSNISVSNGTLEDLGNETFRIVDIPVGQSVMVNLTNDQTGCTRSTDFNSPDCSCDGVTVPSPISLGDQQICVGDPIPPLTVQVEDGIVVDWYEDALGGAPVATSTNAFTPDAAGTYFAEARSLDNNCVSDRVAVSLVINEQPSYSLEGDRTQCASDFMTYSVSFNTNASDVIISHGVLENRGGGAFSVSEIPITQTLEITLTNTMTSCNRTEEVSPPDCSCEPIEVAVPVSNGDVIYCANEPIPMISVTIEDGQTANWYNVPNGGTPIATNTNVFTPTAAGTYYVEAIDLVTACPSDSRTPITVTEQEIPSFSIVDEGNACREDLTFTILFTTDADQVTADFGNVQTLGNGQFRIEGIPSGQQVIIMLSSTQTGCNREELIDGVVCDCTNQNTPPPVSTGDVSLCTGDTIQPLMVTVADGFTVDWYADLAGGEAIAQDTNAFIPNRPGTYFAEARNILNNCVSNERTPITLRIGELPSFDSENGPTCAPSLDAYEVRFTTDAAMVNANLGSVEDLGSGQYRVFGVPVDQTVLIRMESAEGCILDTSFVQSCVCPDLEAPISGGDQRVCEGTPLPALTVSVGEMETVDWYDQPTEGNLLVQGSLTFTPNQSGTYYAETRQIESGCPSMVRTPVSLIIDPLPNISETTTTCAADFNSYEVSFVTDVATLSLSTGTLTEIGNGNFSVTEVPLGEDLVISLINSGTGCTREVTITAPTCDPCDILTISPPVSGGDVIACGDEVIPALQATVPGGITVDWYDQATGGNLLAEDTDVFEPQEPGTYFAEARDLVTQCTSKTRTPITLVVENLPIVMLSDDGATCNADGLTYNVVLQSDADLLENNIGLEVTNTEAGIFTIENVPVGMDVEVTATNTTTSCSTSILVNAPDCRCIGVTVLPPQMANDLLSTCDGAPAPQFEAVNLGDGETVDWFDAMSGGNLIAGGTSSFTPASPGTYYAETRTIPDSCTSVERTPVTWEVLPLPTFELDQTTPDCAPDLLTYTIRFSTDADQVTTNNGVLEDFGNGQFEVSEIPTGTDAEISLVNATTGCEQLAVVPTPECEPLPCEMPNVFLPNAFTPNGDGQNDVLMVRSEIIESMRLIIYNRWGEEMFVSEDQQIGWDGTFKGSRLPPDVYGFYLTVICIGGDTFQQKGNITILR